MNYELAKQLKDAEFHQRAGLEGNDLKSHIKFGFPIYACEHGKANHCENEVFYPKLGELIEACRDGFYSLVHRFNNWQCYGGEQMQICMEGSTPEEAVAKLWLSLDKKV